MTAPPDRPDPVERELRTAMQDAATRWEPSPAPVDAILRVGRARRRARHRALAAVVCTVVLGCGGAVVHQWSGSGDGRATPLPPAGSPHSPASVPAKVTERVGGGTAGGTTWSVTLELYREIPDDYPGDDPRFPPPSGTSPEPGTSLLCQRTVIGGVRVDHQGGPWSGCAVVEGAHGFNEQAGLFGHTDKAVRGFRVLVVQPGAEVTRAVLTLDGGGTRTAGVTSLPGTTYRAYAIPLLPGETVAAVDEYDRADRRVSHQTQWN
ncbi:hypothetical protein AQ490_24220 [Wenjunlia vitaminophila]|uniref:Uncharacterized protein n=1 Tax=Wenjunlia vitaminophila TaxID=76728 RepID=A0A0T6LRM6_WENVI|nr:hypothetical protein [Wenjunlia vitaminophila]KRV48644.1 hypothetical protein AQ490_24220 [Wenjunlia vitaminophila]